MEYSHLNNNDNTKTKAMIQALDNTGVCMFMYYPQTKIITIPKNACETYHCKDFYDDMPHSFARDYVLEDDYEVFKEMYYRIDRGEPTATALFHSKDLKFCNKVTLTTISWNEDGEPEEAFGIIENRSETFKNERLVLKLREDLQKYNTNRELDDALKIMAEAVVTQYYAVYYIWLESRTYVCFQERLPGILSVIGEKGEYVPAWDSYINGYIEECDRGSVRKFVDIDTLVDRIGNSTSMTITYRRKEVGWTRGTFIVGQRDGNGKPLTLIYTVSDINEEVETKLKKQEAEQEALRDPLSKLWNRKAFDQFKESDDFKNRRCGILLFDIDRFKTINDQFGHDVGDQVIVEVAQTVRAIVRNKDIIFRMGGDEFAILLYDCDETIWKTTCRKVEAIHMELNRSLSTKTYVTLSVGICLSGDGYRDEIYKLADQAMYNTKTNGRGGCSMIDLDGNIIKEWHDQNSDLRKGDVLEKNGTVTWRLEIAKDKTKNQTRIFGDETLKNFVGYTGDANPEKLYQFMKSRLDHEYLDLLQEAGNATIKQGDAEAVYRWNHPEKGSIQLRCCSSFDYESDDYYVIVGYMHMLKDMHVFTLEDVNRKIQKALEEMFFCSFYIRLNDYSFEVYKAQSYMTQLLSNYKNAKDAIDAYIKYMVADDSKEDMLAFLDLTTVQKRLENTNVLATIYDDPNIGMARAVIVAVDRDGNGEVKTLSLIVAAIESKS